MSTDISLKKNEDFYGKIFNKKYIHESIHTTVEMFNVNIML